MLVHFMLMESELIVDHAKSTLKHLVAVEIEIYRCFNVDDDYAFRTLF